MTSMWRQPRPGRVAAAMAILALLAGCDGAAPPDAMAGPEAAVDRSDLLAAGSDRQDQQAFDSAFGRSYVQGWHGGADGDGAVRLHRSPAVRAQVVQAFLRDYRPLERTTGAELRAWLERGDAFLDAEGAMAELGLDADNLVDVLALHHAVHWAVVNRDRVQREQLPAIRQAVAASPLLERMSLEDDAARQAMADRAALLAAIRSREYARLLQAGDPGELQRYGAAVAAEFRQEYGIDLRD